MLAFDGFTALCLVALACGLATDAAIAQPTSTIEQRVALNPQPLPPGDAHDPWGLDEG